MDIGHKTQLAKDQLGQSKVAYHQDLTRPPGAAHLKVDDLGAGDIGFVDTGFPEARSRALFERWMTRACSEPAYHVIVADVDGGPAGYVACERKDDGTGQIQLVGVDVAAQRRGLGTQLLNDAMAHFASHGVRHVTVVTQATNLAALRLYESLGFLTRAHDAWYHWWAQESSPADRTLRP